MGEWLDRAKANSPKPTHLTLVAEDNEEFIPTLEDIWGPKGPPQFERSAEDDALDDALKRLGIVGAYRRWSNKSEPKRASRQEGIMVSCPMPDHPDHVPSCWLNTGKDTGCCAVCTPRHGTMFGFDITDLFAMTHHYDVYSYQHQPETFRQVRRDMADDLGLVVRVVGNTEVVLTAEEAEEPVTELPELGPPRPDPQVLQAEPQTDIPPEETDAQVIPIHGGPELEELVFQPGTIDWNAILDDDSWFLRRWMETTRIDDLPEEYYFWLGFVAIGAAVGRGAKLIDGEGVKANLMVCVVGPPGAGKTRAIAVLRRLLATAFPYDKTMSEGVKWCDGPPSGESLVDLFENTYDDPSTKRTERLPVNGVVEYDELATLAEKAKRAGNPVKPKIIEMFDSWDTTSSSSRTAGNHEAFGHHMQMVAGTQPEMLQQNLSREDSQSGFLSRWVFAWGPPKTLVPFKPYIAVDHLVALIQGIAELCPTEIEFDESGREAFTEFWASDVLAVKVKGTNATARLDLLLKKLYLLMALDQHSDVVTRKIVEQVAQLWPYLLSVYGFVEEQTTTSVEVREERKLELEIINKLERAAEAGRMEISGVEWGTIVGNLTRTFKCTRKYVLDTFDQLKRARTVFRFEDDPDGKRGRPRVRIGLTKYLKDGK